MPDFTECQCQGDAGCPHHGEPERIQIMPDGTRLPIPDSPRFRWDSAFGAWCWVRDEGHEAWTLPHLRDRMPQEWHSCCAVATQLWRTAAAWLCDGWDMTPAAWAAYDAGDKWQREFERACTEPRRA